MAIVKTIIKMNHIEALVKVTNDTAVAGSATIDLNVDLLKSNEELSGAPVLVNLGATEVAVPVGAEINITRGAAYIHNYFENAEGYEMPWGADTQANDTDITVNFTGKGTIYMRLLKISGFRPKFRPEQGVNV